MNVTLGDILRLTQGRVEQLRGRRTELEAAAREAPVPAPWAEAFGGDAVSVIAEVKRRSPSSGAIAPRLDPAALAGQYVAGGARAISVLTEQPHFGGRPDDLRAVCRQVATPVLRKDFIIDPVQVLESRVMGASAILLIVRALPRAAVADLAALASEVGLGTLVEVHDRAELEVALAANPGAVGVNSRDLTTFRVDVAATEEVLLAVPPTVPAVAESGLFTRADVERVAAWGADAVLVGTAVARASDPAGTVRSLVGVPRRAGVRAAEGADA